MLENRNYAFAGAFVDELARCGVRHVCYCPGSRSSPLTVSFARHPGIRTWLHLDERSASFFALGMARSLEEPIALVCSSGTAAANFFPAVVEAHLSPAPLLVLTADRPPELHEWGALQTIDQTRMYGSHAKWSVDMPAPEATPELLGYVRALACRACFTAAASPAGPVHVNFPFRDPLDPVAVPADIPDGLAEADDERVNGRRDGRPFVSAIPVAQTPSADDMQRVRDLVERTERGLIICGPQGSAGLAAPMTQLARRLGYPILADVLSQVRCGAHDRSMIVDSYDAFIRDRGLSKPLAPDVVLRFGPLPVSKPLTEYLDAHRDAVHIVVDDGPDWPDPSRLASLVVRSNPSAFCAALASAIGRTDLPDGEWASRWLAIGRASRDALAAAVTKLDGMAEARLFHELAPLLPDGVTVFGGNSMPVRDMDTFTPSSDRRLRFAGNRGASGIDGVVSTALGVAAGSGRRVVLIIGDISFYHDMNGLLAAKLHAPDGTIDATIIVVNNDGGGIFSFLPQAAYQDTFEPYFGTPHGLTFRPAAELYGLAYERAEDWEQFGRAVSESFARPGVSVIEVPVADRKRNVDDHRDVWQAVSASVNAAVRG